jgi:hypothetical protein
VRGSHSEASIQPALSNPTKTQPLHVRSTCPKESVSPFDLAVDTSFCGAMRRPCSCPRTCPGSSRINLTIRRTFQRTRGVSGAHPCTSNLGNAGAMTSRTTSADRSARRRRGIWTSGETRSQYSRTSHPGLCSARIAVKCATESIDITRASRTRTSRDPVPKNRVPATRIDGGIAATRPSARPRAHSARAQRLHTP